MLIALFVLALVASGCAEQEKVPLAHVDDKEIKTETQPSRPSTSAYSDKTGEYWLSSPSGHPLIVCFDRAAFDGIAEAVTQHDTNLGIQLIQDGRATLVNSNTSVRVQSFEGGECVRVRLLGPDINGEHDREIGFVFRKQLLAK